MNKIRTTGKSSSKFLAVSPTGKLRVSGEGLVSAFEEYFADFDPPLPSSFFNQLARQVVIQIAFVDFGAYEILPKGELRKKLGEISKSASKLASLISDLEEIEIGYEALNGWRLDYAGQVEHPLTLFIQMLTSLSEFEENYTYSRNPKEIFYRFIQRVANIFENHGIPATVWPDSELVVFLSKLEDQLQGACFPANTRSSGRYDYVRQAMGRRTRN